jgi:hypothetical protein
MLSVQTLVTRFFIGILINAAGSLQNFQRLSISTYSATIALSTFPGIMGTDLITELLLQRLFINN